MNQVTIRIKYHDQNMPKLQHDPRGDWIDLRCRDEVRLKQGEYAEINLGISMELPVGYEGYIAPRSSTFKKWGIMQTDSGGVMDNCYSGDDDVWHMSVWATRDIVIPKYARIAQFRITANMPTIQFEEVTKLINPNRGGFGATDHK